MPLQNRVTPTGALITTTARGTFIGNRGRLHDRRQRIVRAVAEIAGLPDGAFVDSPDGPRLKWRGALHLWTPFGYTDPAALRGTARVLTPDLSVTALGNGYRPAVHTSAGT